MKAPCFNRIGRLTARGALSIEYPTGPRNLLASSCSHFAPRSSPLLNYKIVLLGVMAVLALLLSCRGEPSPAPQTTEPPPAAQSTQTAHDPTTAPTSLAAGVASAAAATGRPSPTAVQERLSPTDPLPTTAVTPTNPPLPIPALAPATIPAEEIAAIRELAATYWQIFNDYNADGALSMLEESYRSLEDETHPP